MKQTLKYIAYLSLFCGISIAARAETDKRVQETWAVGNKVFSAKGEAIRYIVASGKRMEVSHTRCEILTNKMAFKACPKDKAHSFENEQFSGLKVSE